MLNTLDEKSHVEASAQLNLDELMSREGPDNHTRETSRNKILLDQNFESEFLGYILITEPNKSWIET